MESPPEVCFMPIVGPAGTVMLEALTADAAPLRSLQLVELAAHDCWMVFASCLQVADLQERMPGVGLSVNIHPAYLEDRFFAARVAELVAFTGLDPQLLTLELTESHPVDLGSHLVVRNLLSLRAQGVNLAVDDFGTGYATTARVNELCRVCSFRYLKLDVSLMSAWKSPAGVRRIRHAVYLAQRHGLEIVAEGVETQAQLTFVRRLGCHAQGFFVGRKVPIEHLSPWLKERGG